MPLPALAQNDGLPLPEVVVPGASFRIKLGLIMEAAMSLVPCMKLALPTVFVSLKEDRWLVESSGPTTP